MSENRGLGEWWRLWRMEEQASCRGGSHSSDSARDDWNFTGMWAYYCYKSTSVHTCIYKYMYKYIFNTSIFVVYSQRCATTVTINLRMFSSAPKRNPKPIGSHTPFLLSQPQATTDLLSIAVDLSVLAISHEWNHAILSLL